MREHDDSDIYLELLNRISEQSSNTQKAIFELDKKLDLHIQKTQLELEGIHSLDRQQNKLLDEHIAGVLTLRNMFETQKATCHAKFERIEAPKRLFKSIKDGLLWIAAIVGATLGVMKFFFK